MSLKQDFIHTLGIPKSFKCKHCGQKNRLDISERHNVAECIVSNGAGIWCIVNCDICGVPQQYYPSAINGTPCTEKECDALFEEMKEYESAHSQRTGGKNENNQGIEAGARLPAYVEAGGGQSGTKPQGTLGQREAAGSPH